MEPSAGLTTSKEAYVLFLPSVTHKEYLLGVRVLLFGYKYDHDTRDPSRDVVVMTTPQVPLGVEELLRSEGAIISRNDLITSIPSTLDVHGDQRYKDMYNKLHIWSLTQYERVLYTDADCLMTRSLKGIWDEPEARGVALASRTLTNSVLGDTYLDAGFLLARPDRKMFEELLLVRDFAGHLGDMEQVSRPHTTCCRSVWTLTLRRFSTSTSARMALIRGRL
jgi:alpha-N-acetylglucosamine transferase